MRHVHYQANDELLTASASRRCSPWHRQHGQLIAELCRQLLQVTHHKFPFAQWYFTSKFVTCYYFSSIPAAHLSFYLVSCAIFICPIPTAYSILQIRHAVSVSKSRSRDAVLECLALVYRSRGNLGRFRSRSPLEEKNRRSRFWGLIVSFYKLIFNDRSSLKLVSVIGWV